MSLFPSATATKGSLCLPGFGSLANQPENLMNAETTVGTVRKASGWSMLWGILMFLCGILAISLPLASSIGVVIVLAWLILFAWI